MTTVKNRIVLGFHFFLHILSICFRRMLGIVNDMKGDERRFCADLLGVSSAGRRFLIKS